MLKNSQTSSDKSIDSKTEYILVCGLGSLGQHCIKVLKNFDVPFIAIDILDKEKINWELDNLPDLLEEFINGDCRKLDILEQAKVHECRAVLLVTGDEQVNIETAFVIRDKLKSHVRLVVRSAKENLNESLTHRLGNLVAYDAADLPAQAIATRALGDENRGLFNLGEDHLRVIKIKITSHNQWYGRRLHELNTKKRWVLSYKPSTESQHSQFYEWEPNAIINVGDEVAYIEVKKGQASLFAEERRQPHKRWLRWKTILSLDWCRKLVHKATATWEGATHQFSQPVIQIVFLIWLALLVFGVVILHLQLQYKQQSLLKIFYATAVMLLGGYHEPLGDLLCTENCSPQVNDWILLMNLIYMVEGLLFIGLVNAWLTQWLLNEKFQQLLAYPIPKDKHIVVIGSGPVGRQVGAFLNKFQQSVVVVSTPLKSTIQLSVPLLVVGDFTNAISVVSDLKNSLAKVNLATAKGIVVATTDEMLNVEIALMAHKENPSCALIIRVHGTSFNEYIKQLLPNAKTLCVYNLAAEVFVASAFDKKIISVLWLNDQMILVTNYKIQPDDNLNGMFLSDVAYEYKIVPILYQKNTQEVNKVLPSNNIKLKVGEHLVFLASINSLQKIEQDKLSKSKSFSP